MDPNELFDGFDPEAHAAEAKERWGDTSSYAEAARRTKTYTEADWERIRAEDRDLLQSLASVMQRGESPTSPEALEHAERHRLHIDRYYYACSREMHAGLAGMYEADSRFQASMDQHGEGLTAFLVAAIRASAAAT